MNLSKFMSNLSLMILCLSAAFASLFIVSAINRQQTRRKLINNRFNYLKRKASELVELSAEVEPLLESIAPLRHVNDEIIDIVSTMGRLNPNSPFIEIGLENARHRGDELDAPSYQINTFRLMESDARIAKAQYSLNEVAKILRSRQAKGQMEVVEMDVMIQELAWAHLMVTVITHVGQGHKAVNAGDILRGHAYYKKALESVTQPGYKDDRQNQYILEIGEIMNGKRASLSYELMPENTYNPDLVKRQNAS